MDSFNFGRKDFSETKFFHVSRINNNLALRYLTTKESVIFLIIMFSILLMRIQNVKLTKRHK